MSNIEAAKNELYDATRYYEECTQRVQTARVAQTEALNSLNAAQKRFDDLVNNIRKEATVRGSDWDRRDATVERAC